MRLVRNLLAAQVITTSVIAVFLHGQGLSWRESLMVASVSGAGFLAFTLWVMWDSSRVK